MEAPSSETATPIITVEDVNRKKAEAFSDLQQPSYTIQGLLDALQKSKELIPDQKEAFRQTLKSLGVNLEPPDEMVAVTEAEKEAAKLEREEPPAKQLAERELTTGDITSPEMLGVFNISMDEMKQARQEAATAMSKGLNKKDPKEIERLKRAVETRFRDFLRENNTEYSDLLDYLLKRDAGETETNGEIEKRLENARQFFLKREGLDELARVLENISTLNTSEVL